MDRKLTIDRKDENQRTVLTFKGVIDEFANLKSVFANLKNPVILNLEGIELINSSGVREWVNSISKMPQGTGIVMEKCSPRIVEQINYVQSFLGRGQVKSFFAPYFCPKCKTDANVLLDAEAMKKTSLTKAPPQKCPKCKGLMEFDDVAEEYFAFLQN